MTLMWWLTRSSLPKLAVLAAGLLALVLFGIAVRRDVLADVSPLFDHWLLAWLGAGLVTVPLAIATTYLFELYFIGYERSSLKLLLSFDRSVRYDLLWTLLPLTPIYGTLAYFMTFGMSGFEWPGTSYIKNTIPIAVIALFPLQIIVLELVDNFLQYWQHRAIHTVPALWETHKFHHSAEQMTTLNLMRETPFTVALNGALISFPFLLVGGFTYPEEPTMIDNAAYTLWLAFKTFNALNQFLIHSNLDVTYGWFGRWIIVSPANHRVHHSILPEHYNKNFSVSLVVWDRVFGTYYEGADERAQNCPVGYEGNIYNKSKVGITEYFYPTIYFFDSIYSSFRRLWLRKLVRIR